MVALPLWFLVNHFWHFAVDDFSRRGLVHTSCGHACLALPLDMAVMPTGHRINGTWHSQLGTVIGSECPTFDVNCLVQKFECDDSIHLAICTKVLVVSNTHFWRSTCHGFEN